MQTTTFSATKKIFVLSTSEGCATNLLENTTYRRQYEKQGYLVSDSPDQADVILVNTCGYNKEMEDKATDTISQLHAKFPGKEIVLAGCLPKINPKKIRNEFPDLEVKNFPDMPLEEYGNQFESNDFGGLSIKHKFVLSLRPIFLKIKKLLGRSVQPLENLLESVVVNEEFFLLTVSTGCLGKCTFCGIKKAKGSLRSRPLPTIMAEFHAGLQRGKRKFWLLGDDIGCWGQDLNLSIVDLLREINKIPDDFKLIINYVDPQFLVKYENEIGSVMKDPRIIGVNIPIQSGSDTILESMARKYRAQEVLDLIAELKQVNPSLAVKTNIIVGFPGETWKDFLGSLKSVFRFDAILALKFTARPNTPAAEYQNQIPEFVKLSRMLIINLSILARHAFVFVSSFWQWGEAPRKAIEADAS